MIIETRGLGFVEISEKDILHFSDGIYGFEHIKDYVILKDKDDDNFLWLQSAKSKSPCFVLLNPYLIVGDYRPCLTNSIIKHLKADYDKLSFFVIAVVPEDFKEMTVNLKSPIVVNFSDQVAMQVILENQDYPVRYKVFENIGKAGY